MAYNMNGSGARLTCNSFIASAIGTGDFTYSCLVNSRDVSSFAQKGFVQVSSTSGGLSANYETGFVLLFGLGSNALNTQNGGIAAVIGGIAFGANVNIATTNTWYSVSLKRASGVCGLFVNGSLHASTTNTASLSGTNICLGGYYDTSFTLNGLLAECAFWNTALTDAEILSLSRGFTADQIRPQALSFYAPLVRNLQNLRNGLAITNNNGATVANHPNIIT